MAGNNELDLKQDKPSSGKIERRQIFVSHTHADRNLAANVRILIEEAFSGVIRPYVSSDPAPTGGLQPGEWYTQIHAELGRSESVWVLATPTSIQRPWIYWEAGIGRAICPGAVVVLRVALSSNDVPSPLSNFQSYDGLVVGDDGVGELLGKVANQIGMNISPILIDDVAEKWVKAAKSHKPQPEGETASPKLAPEQLNQFDALIARLETSVTAIRAAPSDTQAARRQAEIREAVSRASRDRIAFLSRILGTDETMYESVDDLTHVIDGAPPEVKFSFTNFDSDEDAVIFVEYEGQSATIWLLTSAMEVVEKSSVGSSRARSLISEIVDAYRAAEEQ